MNRELDDNADDSSFSWELHPVVKPQNEEKEV